jgi:hypothetical protein
MTEDRKPSQKIIHLISYFTPKTTEHKYPPLATSPLPQALFAVVQQVQVVNVVLVDVYPPQHTTYLLMYSVAHSGNTCIVLIMNPFLHPPPSSNL